MSTPHETGGRFLRPRQIVVLCLAFGALTGAAITPGVIGPDSTPKAPVPSAVPPGFTIDRQTTDYSGPIPSVITYAHKFAEVKPGDPDYVPEPKPGEPGYEPSGDGR